MRVQRKPHDICGVSGVIVQSEISSSFQGTGSFSGGGREQIFMECQLWALLDVSSYGMG